MSDAPVTQTQYVHSEALGKANWPARLGQTWQGLESRLMAASDWLNPILVKETRQALKSWQFALTFVLLLVACWIVTIGGIAIIGPSIYYAAAGGELLRAYFFILAFPLLVVVPFAAFRSLAAEREDNTYDLLSITALRPRQIIGGKLGSAVVQMAVYFSAITPCLAFTYLLRGVDIPTIALLLGYTFFASLALSMMGLLLATLTRQRYHQVILSVGFVALLLMTFWTSLEIAEDLVRSGFVIVSDRGFWGMNLALATFYATTFALAYLAAAAMITFNTENRSTPLRLAMLIQQAAFVGWIGYLYVLLGVSRFEVVFAAVVTAGIYWWIMGAMLTSERPTMSRRAMRRLPQSSLGRVFLTWLKPGPSSGYVFAVANLLSLLTIALLAIGAASWRLGVPRAIGLGDLLLTLFVGTSYVIAYLGIGCIVIALLRKVTLVAMLSGVLIHILLLLAGSGIPTSIQLMSLELRNDPYSYLQITNPIWTLFYLVNYNGAPEAGIVMAVIPAAAICAALLNLPGIITEVRRTRVTLPERVARDEAELHPSPDAGPQNPWESEEREDRP